MTHQITIFDNSVKVDPIPYRDKITLRIPIGESKEYVTAKGIAIIVTHKRETVAGVGNRVDFFMISDRGKVLQPITAKGVKHYLRVN